MKKLFIALTALFVLLFSASIAFAQTIDNKNNVTLAQDVIVNENYFASGEKVTIYGTINGDAYVAGGNVYIDGIVQGDVLAAGGNVTIAGIVYGDVRVAGGQVDINGTVNGSVTAGAGSVTLSDKARIGRGIVVGAGQLTMRAPVGGGATIGAGNASIANTIGGNVLAGVGQLTLSPEARIAGNLTYYSETDAQLQAGALVQGTTLHRMPPVTKADQQKAARNAQAAAGVLKLGFNLYGAIVGFIIGVLLVSFFPHFMHKGNEIFEKHPWETMGIGLLALIVTPVLCLLLAATIIGIPLAVILGLVYGIYIYLANVPVAYYAGVRITRWLNWSHKPVMSLLVGVVALMLALSIPLLGGLVQFAVTIAGIGIIVRNKKYYYHAMQTKNLI